MNELTKALREDWKWLLKLLAVVTAVWVVFILTAPWIIDQAIKALELFS